MSHYVYGSLKKYGLLKSGSISKGVAEMRKERGIDMQG